MHTLYTYFMVGQVYYCCAKAIIPLLKLSLVNGFIPYLLSYHGVHINCSTANFICVHVVT